MLIYHTLKTISVCSKVFVECIVYFGEFKEFFFLPSFQLASFTKASPNTTILKRACFESFWHFGFLKLCIFWWH